MQISRRQFMGTVGVVGAGFMLNCQGSEAAEGTRRLAALLQKGGMGPPAELVFKMYQERSGVEVVGTAIPWETQFAKVMVELVGKSTTYDIIPTHVPWRGAMARLLEDVGPYIKKQDLDTSVIQKRSWEGSQWRGRYVGVPFRLGIESLFFYRKDLYEKKGLSIPNTIEELVHNAATLTSPAENIYGFGSQLGGEPTSFLDLQGWNSPFGGRILRDPDQDVPAPYDPHGELIVKVVKAWKQMLDKGWMPKSVVTWGILDSLTALQQGVLAQAIMYSGRAPLIEDPTKSKVAGKMGYSLLFPQVPPKESIGPRADNGSGWNIGINQWISDQQKEEAFKAIKFMVTYEAQLAAAVKAANSPSRTDIMDNPEFQKVYPAWKGLRDGLANFHSGVSSPEQPKLSKLFSDKIAAVLLGKEKPEDAIRSGWKDMDGIMKESRRG